MKPFTVQGLFCLIFAHLLMDLRMRTIHLLFLALASVGVVIIGKPAELGNHLLVNVITVISAALFSLYIALTRRLLLCRHPVKLLFQDGVFAGIAFSVAFLISAQLMEDTALRSTGPTLRR